MGSVKLVIGSLLRDLDDTRKNAGIYDSRSQWAEVSVGPMMVNGRRLTPTRSVGEVSTWLRVTVPHEGLGRWDSSSRFAALASGNSGDALLGTRLTERRKKKERGPVI